jgi:hypothetical protein
MYIWCIPYKLVYTILYTTCREPGPIVAYSPRFSVNTRFYLYTMVYTAVRVLCTIVYTSLTYSCLTVHTHLDGMA